MARPLLIKFERVLYHLMPWRDKRRRIGRGETDQPCCLERPRRTVETYRWDLHAFASLMLFLLLSLSGCAYTQHPDLYLLFQDIKVGDLIPQNLQLPKDAKFKRSGFTWEVRYEQGGNQCASCDETAVVITDLDGTVLAKRYFCSQVGFSRWTLWVSGRSKAEWEVLSPLGANWHRTRPSKFGETAWEPSRVARWLRSSTDEREALPEGTESVLQLLDFRSQPRDVANDDKAFNGPMMGGQGALEDFVHDVTSMCELVGSAPSVSRALERGRLDGEGFHYSPTREVRCGVVIRVKRSRIISGQEAVRISFDDSEGGSWVVWMISGAWIIPYAYGMTD